MKYEGLWMFIILNFYQLFKLLLNNSVKGIHFKFAEGHQLVSFCVSMS